MQDVQIAGQAAESSPPGQSLGGEGSADTSWRDAKDIGKSWEPQRAAGTSPLELDAGAQLLANVRAALAETDLADFIPYSLAVDASHDQRQLRAALCRARLKFSDFRKTKEGQAAGARYKYPPLEEILAAVARPLAEEGIDLSHPAIERPNNGTVRVATELFHAPSGQYRRLWLVLEVVDNPKISLLQCVGVSLTYARRYGLTAMLSVAADPDTDGAAGGDRDRRRDQPPPEVEALRRAIAERQPGTAARALATLVKATAGGGDLPEAKVTRLQAVAKKRGWNSELVAKLGFDSAVISWASFEPALEFFGTFSPADLWAKRGAADPAPASAPPAGAPAPTPFPTSEPQPEPHSHDAEWHDVWAKINTEVKKCSRGARVGNTWTAADLAEDRGLAEQGWSPPEIESAVSQELGCSIEQLPLMINGGKSTMRVWLAKAFGRFHAPSPVVEPASPTAAIMAQLAARFDAAATEQERWVALATACGQIAEDDNYTRVGKAFTGIAERAGVEPDAAAEKVAEELGLQTAGALPALLSEFVLAVLKGGGE